MFCDVCVFFFFFSYCVSKLCFTELLRILCSISYVHTVLGSSFLPSGGMEPTKRRGEISSKQPKKKEATLSFFPPLKGEFTTYKYFLMLHLHAHHSHCLTLDMKRGRCHSCKQDKLAPLRYSLQHYCSSGELHCTRTLLGPLQKAQFQHELCQTHDNLAGLTVR